MKLKPKKTILLSTLVVLSTSIVSASNEAKARSEKPQLVNQESILIAACDFTCFSSCAVTNKC